MSIAPDRAPTAHQHQTARRGLAGLLGLALALVAAAGALVARAWQVGATLGSALFPVEDIVELTAACVGAVVAGRVALHALVALIWVLADRRGLRWAAGERAVARNAPAVVRRLARAAVGAGVGLALAAPTASALPERGPEPPDAPTGPAVVLDLGWQPTDRAPKRSSLVNRSLRDGTDRVPLVVVEPGDTLWALAAEQLAHEQAAAASATASSATDPSPADIAAAVTRWEHANQRALAGNPDLILPGMVLRRP